MDPSNEEKVPLPGSFEGEDPDKPGETATATADTHETNTAPEPQRHYPTRTCRICLETIQPTFEPAPEGITSMLNPAPRVSYISSDPEAGRLIRPCRCSGSSRYVHEGCLQAWRHADPGYHRRNYWECPTCRFQYKLERMRWARWISSTLLQLLLTVAVLFTAIFVFGFIADPIINLYLNPLDTITSLPSGGSASLNFEDGDTAPWLEHFLKGMVSIGLLGFIKVFITSPWHWWNIRQTRVLGGGGRRGGTGRDRLENISWSLVFVGLITFLFVSSEFRMGMGQLLIFIGCVEMGPGLEPKSARESR
jgi:hypothetical protein